MSDTELPKQSSWVSGGPIFLSDGQGWFQDSMGMRACLGFRIEWELQIASVDTMFKVVCVYVCV